ncbi:hypothetical protein [Methylobacterium planeticum]|uniref:Uncharacterized protein n=1 Tax=Methylobacterium planeticum TaxID=2615211 RepID=A0A6N6MIM3_9HYPH|nr:hypothetical protein [Methylobacterium planeticum]KAB1070284.1 hypothetical protein F6X51_22980 [Methylobacterium planeticum]
MLGVLRQVWRAVKATLAIGALVGAALYSADLADRRGVNPFALPVADPETTGSIGPKVAPKPLQRPSWLGIRG